MEKLQLTRPPSTATARLGVATPIGTATLFSRAELSRPRAAAGARPPSFPLIVITATCSHWPLVFAAWFLWARTSNDVVQYCYRQCSPRLIMPTAGALETHYDVKPCSTDADLLEAHRIRVEVFSDEQGFPLDTEVDSNDAISAHFLLVDTSHPEQGLGTLRWVPYPPPASSDTPSTYTPSTPLGKPLTRAQLTASFVRAGSAKLGRLALTKSFRGRGLGARMVSQSEEWITGMLKSELPMGEKVEVNLKLHSQMQVIGFYAA